LTALALGLVGWLSQHHPAGVYFDQRNGPLGFLANNWFLEMRQLTIGGTAWNGSLWTLFYEFLCYLLLMGLAMVGLLRRRGWVLAGALGAWALQALITVTPGQAGAFDIFNNWLLMNLLKFAAVFLVGAAIHLYRDRIPDSGWLALACGVVFVASLWLPGYAPAYYFRANDLGAPLVAYPLLWLGGHLPFQRVGRRNDYSYGVYVYAFPVTVLMAIWGANRWGYVPFAILCLLGTVPFAVASWWLIERRALSLRNVEWNVATAKVLGRRQETTP
jgi:peptidoglycan/LPS O-acetylase OafA/YrhL